MKTILIQAILDHLGYDTGGVDGIAGKKTLQAVSNFQSDFGLTVDGIAGKETAKALAHALCFGMDSQPSLESISKTETVTNESLKTDSDGWGALKYISRNEFRCTCGGKYCNGFPVEPSLATAEIDNAIREHFGKPLTITSGIRCEKRNAEVGGVSNSQHVLGTASDIVVSGVSPSEVYAYAETLMPDYGGLGLYSWGVHVDTRAAKSRWMG